MHTRPGAEFRLADFQAFFLADPLHLPVLDLHRPESVGRTALLDPRLVPALVQEVRIEEPGLRDLFVLVPVDGAVGTGIGDLLLPLRFHRIDQHDAVGALGDGAVLCRLHAGRVIAVVAHYRHEVRLDRRPTAALTALDVHPAMPAFRLRRGIAGELIADVLVLGRQEAVAAVIAARDIDNHVPFLRHYAASDRCQVSTPVHFSN